MPLESFVRSERTGEILAEETLELAADDHGIDIGETSVGSMFNLGRKKIQAMAREASLQKKKASQFQVGDRVKVLPMNGQEGTVDEVGESDVEEGEDNSYVSVVGDDGVQMGGYQNSELVKIGSLKKKAFQEGDDVEDYNGEQLRVIDTGNYKKLKKYDSTGAAAEMDKEDGGDRMDYIAVEDIHTGDTYVYGSDALTKVAYSKRNASLNKKASIVEMDGKQYQANLIYGTNGEYSFIVDGVEYLLDVETGETYTMEGEEAASPAKLIQIAPDPSSSEAEKKRAYASKRRASLETEGASLDSDVDEYDVTATSEGQERTERINIKTNQLFQGVQSTKDIKSAYESFWNDIGSGPEVKVKSIEPVQSAMQGFGSKK